jgi:hypothetical protein
MRYSSFSGSHHRTPSATLDLRPDVATQYRELQELREKVREAELAASLQLAFPPEDFAKFSELK